MWLGVTTPWYSGCRGIWGRRVVASRQLSCICCGCNLSSRPPKDMSSWHVSRHVVCRRDMSWEMSLKNVAQRAKRHVLETCHTDINSYSRGPSTHVKSIRDRAYITFKGITETGVKNLTYLTPSKQKNSMVLTLWPRRPRSSILMVIALPLLWTSLPYRGLVDHASSHASP